MRIENIILESAKEGCYDEEKGECTVTADSL
jgi:hypothetical protein